MQRTIRKAMKNTLEWKICAMNGVSKVAKFSSVEVSEPKNNSLALRRVSFLFNFVFILFIYLFIFKFIYVRPSLIMHV